MVLSCLRRRLDGWLGDRPENVRATAPSVSSSSSLSEGLCRRFLFVIRSDGLVVSAAGSRETPVADWGEVGWAEIAGEVENWIFGRTGSAEVTRGGDTGVVRSARTNVRAKQPRMIEDVYWKQGVPAVEVAVIGLLGDHRWLFKKMCPV